MSQNEFEEQVNRLLEAVINPVEKNDADKLNRRVEPGHITSGICQQWSVSDGMRARVPNVYSTHSIPVRSAKVKPIGESISSQFTRRAITPVKVERESQIPVDPDALNTIQSLLNLSEESVLDEINQKQLEPQEGDDSASNSAEVVEHLLCQLDNEGESTVPSRWTSRRIPVNSKGINFEGRQRVLSALHGDFNINPAPQNVMQSMPIYADSDRTPLYIDKYGRGRRFRPTAEGRVIKTYRQFRKPGTVLNAGLEPECVGSELSKRSKYFDINRKDSPFDNSESEMYEPERARSRILRRVSGQTRGRVRRAFVDCRKPPSQNLSDVSVDLLPEPSQDPFLKLTDIKGSITHAEMFNDAMVASSRVHFDEDFVADESCDTKRIKLMVELSDVREAGNTAQAVADGASSKRMKLNSSITDCRATVKYYRNKLISACPLSNTRSVMCKPVTFNRTLQTEPDILNLPPTAFVPLPVTIPLPFPIPQTGSIVPCFLPMPYLVPLLLPIPIVRVVDNHKDQRGQISIGECGGPPGIHSTDKLACSKAVDILSESNIELPFSRNHSSSELISFHVDSSSNPFDLKSRWPTGVRVFCSWLSSSARMRADRLNDSGCSADQGNQEPSFVLMSSNYLSIRLGELVHQLRRSDGSQYSLDAILYVCTCIHYCLVYNQRRIDQIFFDDEYIDFVNSLHTLLLSTDNMLTIDQEGHVMSRIDEELMWSAGLFGTHTPFILLNTLIYLNSRYFLIRNANDHMSLSFDDIVEHKKKSHLVAEDERSVSDGAQASQERTRAPVRRDVQCLRYYSVKGEQVIYEQSENLDNPQRCAVKLLRFYMSKCPPMAGVTNSSHRRTGPFYLEPERNVSSDSPIWYAAKPLAQAHVEKMLLRIQMIKEVNEAHLSLEALF